MAGTDRRREPILGGPTIVLVEPQLGENIGAVARAMLNFGLTDLRLVKPRHNWLNERTRAMASRADQVLDAARVFGSTREAIADLHRVYATTARRRDMLKPVATARQAAADMRKSVAAGERVGLLFGGERVGLYNDDIVLAEGIVTVPVNPAFASLNLGQAVLLLAYEWFQAGDTSPAVQFDMGDTRIATRAELLGLFDHLEGELEAAGYFQNIPDKRVALMNNIRNSLQRGPLLEQDVRTLRGIIKMLAGRKVPGSRRRKVEMS
ncbi:MAG TPA: RNA methyltransferase [Candidatus Cybelea sp.]|nr:RNA methyltransferase [Candidatus Cybelea sp.]